MTPTPAPLSAEQRAELRRQADSHQWTTSGSEIFRDGWCIAQFGRLPNNEHFKLAALASAAVNALPALLDSADSLEAAEQENAELRAENKETIDRRVEQLQDELVATRTANRDAREQLAAAKQAVADWIAYATPIQNIHEHHFNRLRKAVDAALAQQEQADQEKPCE